MSNRLTIEQRRAHLIEAAIGLAERKGVGAVTTRDVAQAAGVSLGVVHYCFENKDALMTEVVKTLTNELRDSAEQDDTVSTWSETGVDALRKLGRAALGALWQTVQQTRDRQLLTYEVTTYALREGEQVPERLAIAREQYAFNTATLADTLRNLGKMTDIVWTIPVETVSTVAMSIIDGVVLRWLVDGDDDAAATAFEMTADFFASYAAEV